VKHQQILVAPPNSIRLTASASRSFVLANAAGAPPMTLDHGSTAPGMGRRRGPNAKIH
jgi:hypothetical protein